MIQGNEIRLGNWFQMAIAKRQWFYRVLSIHRKEYELFVIADYFEFGTQNAGVTDIKLSNLSGIPLTDKNLLQFGVRSKSFRNGTISYQLDLDGNSQAVEYPTLSVIDPLDNTTSTIIASDVKHLHQLQNLYFSLTGEELTVKL